MIPRFPGAARLGRTDEWRVRDRFLDALKPHYLVLRGCDGHVDGCVRVLPSNGPTMLRDTFPVLLEGKTAPAEPSVWENSRFALDLPPSAPK
ncbi:acyl-homoserine-lactone synthase [Mesorhizobium sp. AaZ16]|uniref:acyl-homoserine-lactone synthase n=1 Tax=Mesorhizobium sp. AaZ16 TaxID=3402289 RepID=UPI00374F410A